MWRKIRFLLPICLMINNFFGNVFLNPRRLLFLASALDLLGLFSLLVAISCFKQPALQSQLPWLAFLALAYTGFSWLFGSYTVLRWRRLPPLVVLQRVLFSVLFTFFVVALVRIFLNPAETVWIVHRSSQAIWMPLLMLWSLLLRVLLRRGVLVPLSPQMYLVGSSIDTQCVMAAWKRTPHGQPLRTISLEKAVQVQPPVLLAIAPSRDDSHHRKALMEVLLERDPRETSLVTPLHLLERQLERLPPVLVPDPWIDYQDLPCNKLFSLSRQLKRGSDLLVSGLLLVLTSPILLMSMLLIWLEDRGPIFYFQYRSGWLGCSFQVYKLRTMTVSPHDEKAVWTMPGDRRITRVGLWLRRLRIDELPQLVNVLRGDMSLIGPRPERPELEHMLEERIPHYRKRHWMRPGLSGWAQVCAPYAASVEDSDLKLSYDLYYLKNFSTWLDLIILFRTVKTVLKAGGR